MQKYSLVMRNIMLSHGSGKGCHFSKTRRCFHILGYNLCVGRVDPGQACSTKSLERRKSRKKKEVHYNGIATPHYEKECAPPPFEVASIEVMSRQCTDNEKNEANLR